MQIQIICYHVDEAQIRKEEERKRRIHNRIFITFLVLSFGTLLVKLILESIFT